MQAMERKQDRSPDVEQAAARLSRPHARLALIAKRLLDMLLAAAMLLRHSLNLEQPALAIEEAVESVLKAGHRTREIAPAGGAPCNTKGEGQPGVHAPR